MQIHGNVTIRFEDNDLRSVPAWYCMYKKQLSYMAAGLPEKAKHSAEFSVRINDSAQGFDFDFKTGRFRPDVEAKLNDALYARMATMLEIRSQESRYEN